MLHPTIHQAVIEAGGVITASQIQKLGFSKTLISNYVKAGKLDRIAHGIYMLPGEIEDDMYTLMLRTKKLIFSHETALFLSGLSDRTPFVHSITIPSNAAIPPSIKAHCVCYYVKPELHQMGMVEKPTTFGHIVRCYNPERTICDLLRSRSRCDEETVISALKRFAASKEKNLNLLSTYAVQLNVSGTLKKYMEVLL